MESPFDQIDDSGRQSRGWLVPERELVVQVEFDRLTVGSDCQDGASMQVSVVVPSHICNPSSQQGVVDDFGDGGKRLALFSSDVGRDGRAHAIPGQPWAEGILAIY